MNSKTDREMIRVYNSLLKHLLQAGIGFEVELVPPCCHHRNATEVAICNFKVHFLSVFAGITDSFPSHLWDCLLPQTEITLNLLRQSNATPTVSAYTHLCGFSTITRCIWSPWVVKSNCKKRPIRGELGPSTVFEQVTGPILHA
eukprot:CCRYP_007642-RA/>CCRYP_007642-RA protein AED:0.44 eAED:0.44 QI:0/0/0/1/0/0/2/0/143